jgi:hypothetical protein
MTGVVPGWWIGRFDVRVGVLESGRVREGVVLSKPMYFVASFSSLIRNVHHRILKKNIRIELLRPVNQWKKTTSKALLTLTSVQSNIFND